MTTTTTTTTRSPTRSCRKFPIRKSDPIQASRRTSLVLDRRADLASVAGLHVHLIGISDYTYLPEQGEVAHEETPILRKLGRSALTAFQLMRKIVELDETKRLLVPLKTLRIMQAPSPGELDAEPELRNLPSDASRMSIERSLREWRDDADQLENEQAWFFFSGHTLLQGLENRLLLASDFMQPDVRPVTNSFGIHDVRNGMAEDAKRRPAGRRIYFIDASDSAGPSLSEHILYDNPGERPSPIFDGPFGLPDGHEAPALFAGRARDLSAEAPVPGRLTTWGEALIWGFDNAPSGNRSMAERDRAAVTPQSLFLALGSSGEWGRYYSLEAADANDDMAICISASSTKTDLQSERLNTQRDNPATIDALGRRWFARILAARIVEAHGSDGSNSPAFMVHLHGPWGSGKSSVLNFVEHELKSGEHGNAWLVVDFNAWKFQRLRPPWWSLIRSIYSDALDDPEVKSNLRLRAVWWRWRLRADWLPIMLVGLIMGTGAFAIAKMGGGNSVLPGVAAVITASAGVYGYARYLLFGSAKAAQTYLEIRDDPFGPVITLLNDMIAAIGRPVIVFIDDLDRCDSDYVVELLEGIQTLQRSAPITYLVAADRKWICSSIEKKYSDFAPIIGEAGRPLGYLFLDKMFQVSVGIPRLSAAVLSQYWTTLLSEGRGDTPDPEALKNAREVAEKEVQGLTTQEELQRVVDASANESLEVQQAVREQAAMQITSAPAAMVTEHRLAKFASMLEPNPRSLKRLVNAVALTQASSFLEGRNADIDVLARWAMVELRWPILADFLASNPELIDAFQLALGQPMENVDSNLFPAEVACLSRDRDLCVIMGREEGKPGLDSEALKAWLG